MTTIIGALIVLLLISAVVVLTLHRKGRSWDIELHVHDTPEDEDENHHGR